jgi:hypothetical protein
MTNPRALVLSIAATACGFLLLLGVIVGQASIAPTPAVGAAMAPSSTAAVDQEVSSETSPTTESEVRLNSGPAQGDKISHERMAR